MNKKLLLIILLVSAMIVPRAIMFSAEIIDPFAYSTAALAEIYSQTGRIVIHPFSQSTTLWLFNANDLSVRIIPSTLLYILSATTSVSLDILPFLPITGFIFMLFAYVFALAFSKSKFVAILFTLVMAFDIQVIRATNITFYITLGYTLLFCFLTLYLKMSESKVNSKPMVLLVFIAFLSLFLTYYSSELFSVAFSIALLLPVFTLGSNTLKQKLPFKNRFKFPVSFSTLKFIPPLLLLIFLGFDVAVPEFFQMNDASSLFAGYASTNTNSLIGKMSSLITLSYQMLLLLPVVIFVIYYIIQWIRKTSTLGNVPIRPFLALIVSVIVFSFTYINFGLSIFSRAFYLIFPLLAFYSIYEITRRHKSRRFLKIGSKLLYALLIIVPLVISSLFLFDPTHPYAPDQKTKITPAVSFTANNCVNGTTRILTSLDISAQLFYTSVKLDKSNIEAIEFGQQDSVLYDTNMQSVDNTFIEHQYNLLLLSKEFENRVVFASGWQWAPIAPNASLQTSANPSFNRVYDNGEGTLFAFTQT